MISPGVAQLVGRLVWDQDAASSSLATRTTISGRFIGVHFRFNYGEKSILAICLCFYCDLI